MSTPANVLSIERPKQSWWVILGSNQWPLPCEGLLGLNQWPLPCEGRIARFPLSTTIHQYPGCRREKLNMLSTQVHLRF